MSARKYVFLMLLIILLAGMLFYLLMPRPMILWSQRLTIVPAFSLPQPLARDDQNLYIGGAGISDHPAHPVYNTEWRIEKRSLTDGSLIAGFGSQGIITSEAVGRIRHIIRDEENIFLVGDDRDNWRIEKRRSVDGSLIPEFGTDGVIRVEGDQYESLYPAAIVLTREHIIVAGHSSIGLPLYVDRGRLEKRTKTDGALATDFGNQGVILIDARGIQAMVADDSFFYIAANDLPPRSSDSRWHIEKRSLSDGALDPSFGLNGIVIANPTPDNDHINAIALGGDYLYVLGFSAGSGLVNWRLEKRQISDGALVDNFGTGGVIISSKMQGYASPMDIVLDPKSPEALYIAGRASVDGEIHQVWYIEKRRTSDGSLLTNFGPNGVLTHNTSNRDEGALGLVIGKKALYVVGENNSKVTPGVPGGWQSCLIKIRK